MKRGTLLAALRTRRGSGRFVSPRAVARPSFEPRRALAGALVAALAALAAAATATRARADVLPPDGTVVARLGLAAPAQSTFVVRATVPVPRGTYPRATGESPFHVRGPDGELRPAQTEIVSRYPAADDGADVVEVLARVDRPAAVAPGTPVEYEVVVLPHATPNAPAGAAVEQLLAASRSLLVRTRDVFGNRYAADVYDDVRSPGGDRFRILRNGVAAETYGTHEFLRPTPPVAGSAGTLPHMMGVHAYVTRWAGEDFFALDLRVHDAASGNDRNDPVDDALGKLYFSELELRLPQGWVVLNAIPDPYFGAPRDEGAFRAWPIVAPLASGKMHVMPQMAQFERRLVVARQEVVARARAALQEEWLAFARPGTAGAGFELWSWWNQATSRYFPQRRRMPDLAGQSASSIRASQAGQLASRLAQVATGSQGLWPAESAGLGWAHPWGVTDGGMVSGEEIWLFDGMDTAWAGSTAGYRLHQLRQRMYTDRQRNVLFNKGGLPTAHDQWIVHTATQDVLPIWWFSGPMLWASDPFGFGQAPTFHTTWVASHGLNPPYEQGLESFQSIDESHLVRYTHDAKVLAWLGNDALAKDDLRGQAEAFRLGYSELEQDVYHATIPSGLRASQNYVATNPGNGIAFGRREGWGLDAVCAAYSTQDAAYRARTRPWLESIVDVLAEGQSTCTGTIQASNLINVFNGQYRCRQSIEAAITEHMLVGLRESVFGRALNTWSGRLNAVIANSTHAMISPLFWSNPGHAPWALVAVGPGNANLPLYCSFIPTDGNYGNADGYQCWSSFAYGYEVTGDPAFLARAQEMLGQSLLPGLQTNALDNLQNRAALLDLAQRIY